MIGALTGCSLIAACGSSAKSASPGPGVYRGTTSQGQPLTLTVSPDGKSLASIEVQAKYTCPAGATAVDGIPRSPGGAVPLANGNSFSGSFTARGTSYQLSGSYRSGTFSGTLSASFPALTGSGSCTSGSVSWKATRGNGSPTPTATTATTSTSTTTTAPPASGTPRERLAVAAAAYNAGAATFNARSKVDTKAGELTAFKSDIATFRAVLAQFDSTLPQIDFPPGVRPLLGAVLEADHLELADLDASASAKTAATAIGFYNRAVADNQKVIAAEDALYKAI